jgi:hypothetical protein
VCRRESAELTLKHFMIGVCCNETEAMMKTAMLHALPLVALLFLVMPARAELGGKPTWSAGMAGSATTQTARLSAIATPYTVNETTLPSGTTVREYVAPGGTVFAVVWQGPQMAPLNTLLGPYFQDYLQGLSVSHAAQGGYGPAVVEQAKLVVQTGGHMGAFTGRAYLPRAFPQGAVPDDAR